MNVRIVKLTKRFQDVVALQSVSAEVRSEELFFLLGPSGCGKTTLLRTLAGFYQPDEGEIWFGHRRMNDVPPHRRNTGMVFQNYALWPHMTVEENVAYGLEVRKVSGAERRRRVQEALAIVQMEAYAKRTPNQLSGGQQQRVALARALVIKPDVLLLDEPLSNLDARLRLEMREEIRRIHAETRITTVYVTHDQKEALSLADRIAVMRDGRIEQIGDPREVYRSPANRFVADFIGETNWLSGEVERVAGDFVVVRTELGPFHAQRNPAQALNAQTWLGFRPEAVKIGPAEVNRLETRITHVTYLGEIEQYALRLSNGAVIKAFEQNPLEIRKIDTLLAVHIPPQDIFLLPRNSESETARPRAGSPGNSD